MTAIHPTALFRSAAFYGHDTGAHPEHPRRLAAIDAEIEALGLGDDRPEIPWGPADFDTIARVHHPRYLDLLTEISENGGGWLDADTYCGGDSLEVAMMAAGAAVAAVDATLNSRSQRAFALVRPPGHHATANRGMGFCLLNNIAVAAGRGLDRGLERIAIVDWDVHHGNGTQDIFYGSNNVLFCSVHQYGNSFYPGSGARDERGAGAGEGFTVNVPLAAGKGDPDYLDVFDHVFAPAIRAFEPELVLVSAGFDAHLADPIGGMRVTADGFAAMTRQLVEIANQHANGRLVAVLEGGYDPRALARSVVSVIGVLDRDDPHMYDGVITPERRFAAGKENHSPE